MRTKTLSFTISLVAVWAISAVAQIVEPPAENGADQAPYIRAALPLDEPRHLCIDIPGHGERVDTTGDVTVHTCKDGMWNLDQRFEWIADGTRLRMPQYQLCLSADPSSGSALKLADCGAGNTNWISEHSRIKHGSDASLCVTIADEMSQLTPGGKRFPFRARARSISLEPCAPDAIERQLWSVTQPLDLEEILMPPAGSLPVEN